MLFVACGLSSVGCWLCVVSFLLFGVLWLALFVCTFCCVLRVACFVYVCRLSYVDSCVLFVVCDLLYVVGRLLFVERWWLVVGRCVLVVGLRLLLVGLCLLLVFVSFVVRWLMSGVR